MLNVFFMSEDILKDFQNGNPNSIITFTSEMFNEALIRIDNICILMNNKSIDELGLDTRSETISDRKHFTRKQL